MFFKILPSLSTEIKCWDHLIDLYKIRTGLIKNKLTFLKLKVPALNAKTSYKIIFYMQMISMVPWHLKTTTKIFVQTMTGINSLKLRRCSQWHDAIPQRNTKCTSTYLQQTPFSSSSETSHLSSAVISMFKTPLSHASPKVRRHTKLSTVMHTFNFGDLAHHLPSLNYPDSQKDARIVREVSRQWTRAKKATYKKLIRKLM